MEKPKKQKHDLWSILGPLLGVLLGGMLSWIPLSCQLKHDSKERDKERMMSVRYDAYIFAAEKIGQSLCYLTNLLNNREFSLEGYMEAINRIQVIGSKGTLEAIDQFDDFLDEAFSELYPQTYEIDLLKKRIDSLTEVIDKTYKEREICIEQMKEYHLSGIKDEQKLSVIKSRSAIARRLFNQSMNERMKTSNKILKLTDDLAPRCLKKAQEAEELILPVMVAIRNELDTPFDEEAYQTMMKASHKKSKDNLDKYIASMKDKYEAFQAIEQENIFDEGIN